MRGKVALQGAFCSSAAAVRAERVAGEKYDAGGAVAALATYYTNGGAPQCVQM